MSYAISRSQVSLKPGVSDTVHSLRNRFFLLFISLLIVTWSIKIEFKFATIKMITLIKKLMRKIIKIILEKTVNYVNKIKEQHTYLVVNQGPKRHCRSRKRIDCASICRCHHWFWNTHTQNWDNNNTYIKNIQLKKNSVTFKLNLALTIYMNKHYLHYIENCQISKYKKNSLIANNTSFNSIYHYQFFAYIIVSLA